MKGPFEDWITWRFTGDVESSIGIWTNDSHPVLGAGIFRFSGSDGLTIHERGIASIDGRLVIPFTDIIGYDYLSLRELMLASHSPWENVELRVRTTSGETALMLPLAQANSLGYLLKERARRARRP